MEYTIFSTHKTFRNLKKQIYSMQDFFLTFFFFYMSSIVVFETHENVQFMKQKNKMLHHIYSHLWDAHLLIQLLYTKAIYAYDNFKITFILHISKVRVCVCISINLSQPNACQYNLPLHWQNFECCGISVTIFHFNI